MFIASRALRFSIPTTLPHTLVESKSICEDSAYRKFLNDPDVERYRRHFKTRGAFVDEVTRMAHLHDMIVPYMKYGFVHRVTPDHVISETALCHLNQVKFWKLRRTCSSKKTENLTLSDARLAYDLLKEYDPESIKTLEKVGIVDSSGDHFNLNASSPMPPPNIRYAYEDFVHFLNEVGHSITLSGGMLIYDSSRIILHPSDKT